MDATSGSEPAPTGGEGHHVGSGGTERRGRGFKRKRNRKKPKKRVSERLMRWLCRQPPVLCCHMTVGRSQLTLPCICRQKTCYDWLAGTCKRGDLCRYSHSMYVQPCTVT